MQMNRRSFMTATSAAAAVALVGLPTLSSVAYSATPEVDEAIKAFTGGAEVKEGRIELETPEIAENGNTVPVEVSVESPMTDADHVTDVIILAAGNPNPGVATFKFTPMSGEAAAKTRIRLATTQDVVAIAKMSDGSFHQASSTVKVTIGGCGG